MDHTKAFKHIRESCGMSEYRIAQILGAKQPTVHNKMCNGRSITINSASDILGTMNYVVAFVPKGSKLPAHSYVIDEVNDD